MYNVNNRCIKSILFISLDIALKDDCGVADSMYNIQLIIQFCESLPTKCLHLSLNDLFYSQEDIKRNIIVLLAELFLWFEVSPAPIVANVTRQEVSRPTTSVIPSEGEVDDGNYSDYIIY